MVLPAAAVGGWCEGTPGNENSAVLASVCIPLFRNSRNRNRLRAIESKEKYDMNANCNKQDLHRKSPPPTVTHVAT